MEGNSDYSDPQVVGEILPSCKLTGVGKSPNEIYEQNGYRSQLHEVEDHCFHYEIEKMCMYGVFDGHNGQDAANFAVQRFPAELLDCPGLSDEELVNVLREAFISTDRVYFETVIGQALAERAGLLEDYEPHELNSKERYKTLTREVSSGAAAVVALIHNEKIIVANVGDCQAILCQRDSSGNIRTEVLSVTHDFNNIEEIRRLQKLNVDVSNLYSPGGQHNTRCLGNYLVKGGYQEIFPSALSEPIIPDPDIRSTTLTSDEGFLVLVSHGVIKALIELNPGEESNVVNILVSTIIDEFRNAESIELVAQSVITNICNQHHAMFMKRVQSCQPYEFICKKEDMTLLVRNFNFGPSNSQHAGINGVSSVPTARSHTTAENISENKDSTTTEYTPSPTESTSATCSLAPLHKPPVSNISHEKVHPYVDFGKYFEACKSNSNLENELNDIFN